MTERTAGEPIIFTKEDDQVVQFPYNDAIVVTLNIENYDVCFILIDNGSSAIVLYYDAVINMGISPKQQGRVDFLVKFTRDESKLRELSVCL